uniref:Lipoprotein n=1 Tax=Vibrio sp. FF_291 TaxID=1652832 RepID=A0A0H3ZMV3_9VIBR|nr:hypothetical protein [Vibrio sp. FF_291]
MLKKILVLLVITLSGCATSPTEEVDVKNSPCACIYDGRQLLQPTDAEKIEIIQEVKSA